MIKLIIGIAIGLVVGLVLGIIVCIKLNNDWADACLEINKEWGDYCKRLIKKYYEDEENSEEESCTDCKWYGTFTCECPTHCTVDSKIAWEVTSAEDKKA